MWQYFGSNIVVVYRLCSIKTAYGSTRSLLTHLRPKDPAQSVHADGARSHDKCQQLYSLSGLKNSIQTDKYWATLLNLIDQIEGLYIIYSVCFHGCCTYPAFIWHIANIHNNGGKFFKKRS